jgi:hypothetical protein
MRETEANFGADSPRARADGPQSVEHDRGEDARKAREIAQASE